MKMLSVHRISAIRIHMGLHCCCCCYYIFPYYSFANGADLTYDKKNIFLHTAEAVHTSIGNDPFNNPRPSKLSVTGNSSLWKQLQKIQPSEQLKSIFCCTRYSYRLFDAVAIVYKQLIGSKRLKILC